MWWCLFVRSFVRSPFTDEDEINIYIPYTSVSQTMVRGPPVFLEICPCGPKKNTEEKFKFKWSAYHSTAENLRVWKWHMATHFHIFSLYWYFMKFNSLSIYRFPTLLSAIKEGFKVLWTWCFSPFFPCTFGAAPVTQPGTTRIQNRGPMYWTYSCIYGILDSFADTQCAHWNGHVLYIVHQS